MLDLLGQTVFCFQGLAVFHRHRSLDGQPGREVPTAKFLSVTTPGSHRRSQEIQTAGWLHGAFLFNLLLEVLLQHRTRFVQPGCTIEVLPVPPSSRCS
jgi:hypothetical protein